MHRTTQGEPGLALMFKPIPEYGFVNNRYPTLCTINILTNNEYNLEEK